VTKWKPLTVLACTLLAGPALAPAFAAECATEIEGDDLMKFNKADISVPTSCKEFKVTLKHTGQSPKTAMGHNWVLSKTSDLAGVAGDGLKGGLENDFLKPSDPRVIAHTKVVGGGESASVSFATSKLQAGENYAFFCSFPGHAAIMKGTLTLTK